jgi:hypothetical protein
MVVSFVCLSTGSIKRCANLILHTLTFTAVQYVFARIYCIIRLCAMARACINLAQPVLLVFCQLKEVCIMAYITAFAGINGSTASTVRHDEVTPLSKVVAQPAAARAAIKPFIAPAKEKESERKADVSKVLFDPSGKWAVHLHTLTADRAQTLLQILRDLAPVGTQVDAPLLRRVSAYDEAATKDPLLTGEILRDLGALDNLAFRMSRKRYHEIAERALRRTLLSQMSEHPLMNRLGVHMTAYAV